MKKLLWLGLLIVVSTQIFSLNVPKLQGRINDYANILNSKQKAELEAFLHSQEMKTSSQIAVLIIPSLRGENLEDYSMKVVEKWKLGQKEFDNGVLLLIALSEKKIRIEVGYGLEHILTDMKCGYIIRNIIVPEFKKGNFYRGIFDGLQAISGLITNEFVITDEQLAKYRESQKKSSAASVPFGLIIFIFFLLISSRRRGRGGLLPMIFLGSMLGGRGGRGGSGFGGFGGFSGGGGGFGGGGASGGW
ncbi:MAG: methanol dehydrogenase [Candidatus Cloacimonadota bacterium]|nr:MAG: methanol dehydrogenase [Candidatus Cloacimonadota bacterium]